MRGRPRLMGRVFLLFVSLVVVGVMALPAAALATATASGSGNSQGPGVTQLTGQVVPDGVRRIGGLESSVAGIDGERREGRYRCRRGRRNGRRPSPWRPQPCWAGRSRSRLALQAGVARNDGGWGHWCDRQPVRRCRSRPKRARIWSVQLSDGRNPTTLQALLCAMDWVIANADTIEVVNMSTGYLGTDDGNCGVEPPDPFLARFCEAADEGVTFVASAGNSSEDTAQTLPAAYDEVIAVSAVADYNGLPGGGAPQDCFTSFDDGADDTFARYSNFGADIDLAGPGNCIFSTSTNRDLRVDVKDGLSSKAFSMIAWASTALAPAPAFPHPHVAGAAALG